MGANGVGALFDEVIDLAASSGELLAAHPDFDLAANPQLSTLVFRYKPAGSSEADADSLNPLIRSAVFASGEAVVAGTKVDGHHFLKFTLLNAETSLADIKQIIELLRSTGESLRGSGFIAGGAA